MKNLDKTLIAPCGMNCAVCMAYLRAKNRCHGCRAAHLNKPVTRLNCRIKNCEALRESGSQFCGDCAGFPCDRLKHLDKRYRTKYGMSMIENLGHIGELGLDAFVKNEITRWTCKECGGTICVHRAYCVSCGKAR